MKAEPRDATLIGNVVIHIVPAGRGDISESFIYLDNIDYISEGSRFITSGPVTFISKDVRMVGRGLEIVYNEMLERLEVLRIIDIESLRLKKASPGDTSAETAVIDNTEEIPTSQGRPVSTEINKRNLRQPPKPSLAKTPDKKEVLYRCTISDNVVIETSDSLVYAAQIHINDILFSGSSKRDKDTGTAMKPATDVIGQIEQGQTGTEPVRPKTEADDTEDSAKTVEFIESPEDTVLTCSKGVLVTPMDSRITPPNDVSMAKAPVDIDSAKGRSVIKTQIINYSVPSGQAELMGDCVCTSFEQSEGFHKRYRLSAPRVLASLRGEKSSGTQDFANAIEYLTAGNGIVQLDTSKWNGAELIGFTKLKCLNIEYKGDEKLFTATGPQGKIAVDNSKMPINDERADNIQMQKPCYVLIEGFESLKYSIVSNTLQLAAASNDLMQISYLPIVDGQSQQPISATAATIEAKLTDNTEGVTGLESLKAHGGISYDDKDVQFIADDFYYNSMESCITAWCEGYQSCFLNGTPVDGIEYDLKTGKAKSKMFGPGTFEIK
ncbi:MAG: hypothetical protein E4H40_05705 [Candidatus Brocadiia bacterium]|nr:MAG: hypothetical protein E4H40_05705 [Candidatus Brocadiia bacterium]